MRYPEFSHGTAVESTTGMYIFYHDLHMPSRSFIGGPTHEIQHVDTPNISLCETTYFSQISFFSDSNSSTKPVVGIFSDPGNKNLRKKHSKLRNCNYDLWLGQETKLFFVEQQGGPPVENSEHQIEHEHLQIFAVRMYPWAQRWC